MTLWAALALVPLWIVDKATGGIVSEYGKRVWFKHIEPRIGRKVAAAFGRSGQDSEAQRAEALRFAQDRESRATREIAVRALRERDELLAQVIRLNVLLSEARQVA